MKSIKNDGLEKDNPSRLSVIEKDTQQKVTSKPTGIQLRPSSHFKVPNIECNQEVPSLNELKRGIIYLGYGQPLLMFYIVHLEFLENYQWRFKDPHVGYVYHD